MRKTWPWWALASVIAVWLLWMTCRPNPTVAADLAPLTASPVTRVVSAHVLISLIGNVVVFVPLGASLALALGGRPARSRVLWATLIGAGLSAAIELVQLALPTRVSGLDDWLLNTAGVFLGAVGACAVPVGDSSCPADEQLEDLADLAALHDGADESTRPFSEFLSELD